MKKNYQAEGLVRALTAVAVLCLTTGCATEGFQSASSEQEMLDHAAQFQEQQAAKRAEQDQPPPRHVPADQEGTAQAEDVPPELQEQLEAVYQRHKRQRLAEGNYQAIEVSEESNEDADKGANHAE
jgi:hypothetical protein